MSRNPPWDQLQHRLDTLLDGTDWPNDTTRTPDQLADLAGPIEEPFARALLRAALTQRALERSDETLDALGF